jgi:hypothetical protein
MSHDTLGGYGSHVLVGLMNALAALEFERESNGVDKVSRIGGRELIVVGHVRTIAPRREQSKNVLGVGKKMPRALWMARGSRPRRRWATIRCRTVRFRTCDGRHTTDKRRAGGAVRDRPSKPVPA